MRGKDFEVLTNFLTKVGVIMLVGIGVSLAAALVYFSIQWGLNHPKAIGLMGVQLAALIAIVMWGIK
jgi:hypothetical protein